MSTTAPQPARFIGEFRHVMDEKKRITIPIQWREIAGNELLLLAGRAKGKIEAFRPEAFEKLGEELTRLPDMSPRERRDAIRALYSRAMKVEPDKQGRFVLPQTMWDRAELGTKIVFAGVRDTFEIWNEAAYDRSEVTDAADSALDLAMETIGR